MQELKGVYTYKIPDSITKGIEGVRLYQITEEPASYEAFPDPQSVTILIARQGKVNDLLRNFPNIKWLQLLNAGYEKVDLDLLKTRGITFTNARSVYCKTIAEDVFAKILFLSRNYLVHIKDQQRSFWPDDAQLLNLNLDIEGRSIGILGAGNIGREIAVRSKAFGMRVLGYDPYLKSQIGFDRIYQEKDGLDEMLSVSDFIITCLPLSKETKDIINKETFALMKKSAFFINVARGDIVDENALIYALENDIIRGAFIDVCKQEPLAPDSPLWKTKNLLITPHRAAYGDLMEQRMCKLIESNIKHYLAGETLENLVSLV
jgi:D-2-hydroxyacid dehydrogenase (NADP+)